MSYLNFFSIIHPSQSGFRPGHSTESALTLMTEKWLKAINEGKMVGAVMVDFRKALALLTISYCQRKLNVLNAAINLFL